MNRKIGILVSATAVVLAAAWQAGVTAQQPAPAWNGLYTEAQATRGAPLYAQNCVMCHMKDLLGGERAPAAGGPAFVARWTVKAPGDLLDYIHSSMPLQSPGGLSRQQSADIMAYMLQQSKLPAGTVELSGGPVAAAAPTPDLRQAEMPRAEGFYTRTQAVRGKAAFNRNCAYCHTVDARQWTAESNAAVLPRTFGGRFLERVYHGKLLYPSVYYLFKKLDSMPAFNTKAISPKSKADIVAYLLEANGKPAGPDELTDDTEAMKSMMLNEPGFESLFNGKDFSGIKFVLGPGCTPAPAGCGKSDPGNIVYVEHRMIRCECSVHGYLYFAQRKYRDFTLRFDHRLWRPADWTSAEDDSLFMLGGGVLLFINDHRVWPRSIEVEGRRRDFGDIVAIAGKAKYTYDNVAKERANRPVGEWDSVEIVSRNGEVKTYLNGTLVTTISEHDYKDAGFIGFQVEGGPTDFRNIRIKPE